MSNSDAIEFECPDCRETIQISRDQASSLVECPACHASVKVPPEASKSDPLESLPPVVDDEIKLVSDDAWKTMQERPPVEPLKIDQLSDSKPYDDVYGIHCRICETLVHVRPEQVDSVVECPVCFSQVPVTAPKKSRDRPPTENRSQADSKLSKPALSESGDELRLSDPIERPTIELSHGLDPVTEDLLAPKPVPPLDEIGELSDIPELEILNSPSTPEVSDQPTPPPVSPAPKKKLSRRERLEAYQRRDDDREANRSFVNPAGRVNRLGLETDFPNHDAASTLKAVPGMLLRTGLIWRSVIATLLMGFGVIVMESFAKIYKSEANGESATMMEGLLVSAQWFVFGALPYLIGVIFLWFVCGYVFRDAALGQRYVANWKNAGIAEISGTFLLFSFGFFVAGLPISVPGAFLGVALVLPLQMLLAPPFLLSAWFNQSPFAIVSVDAFERVIQQKSEWTSFYICISALTLAGMFIALLFWIRTIIPVFAVNAIISLLATTLTVLVTLLFATICGWHCGRVVSDLEESA